MANKSVLELAVETGKWDSGLKKAKSALDNFITANGGLQQALGNDADKMQKFVQMMGSMESKANSTRGSLREMTQTIADLTVYYRALSDEEKNTDFGKELNKSIQELTERAGNLRDAMGDVEASVTNAASDTRVFDQLAQGASVAMAGIQGLTGAFKLLGIDMGDNLELIARLQAAMAVTNSLTTIQNALQGQSALMQGVLAARASLAASAQTALAAATGNATLAQKAFNTVANMNPYVLLATAIGTVVGAMFALSSASSDAEKDIEEMTKAAEEAKKKIDDLRTTIVSASAASMNAASRINSLQVAYMQANSELEKTEILEQAAQEFKKLGMECNGVTEAQNLLIENGPKVLEMIRLQGEIAATSALRMEAFKKSYQRIIENQQYVGGDIDYQYAALLAGVNDEVMALDQRLNSLQTRMRGVQLALPSSAKGGNANRNANTNRSGSPTVEPAPPAGSMADLNRQMQELRKAQELVTSTSAYQMFENILNRLQMEAEVLRGNLTLTPEGANGVSLSRQATVLDASTIAKKVDEEIRNLDLNTNKTGKKEGAKMSDIMGEMNSGIGQLVQGLEGLGVEIPKGMQDTLNVLQSITLILTSIEAFQKVGALLGVFSHGGVVTAASGYTVPGRRFSGDMIPARLNAGELVLNQAQAGVIASALQDRDFSGGMGGQPYTDGENIILGINNTYKRKGMGEIVTTSMLRRMGIN